MVEGEPTITRGVIHLRDDVAGHGLTLNEDVARAHVKPGYGFFAETPWG